MYLHIGNNVVINTDELIGIFDIETTKKQKSNLLQDNEIIKKIETIDISEGKAKSYILLKKKDKIVKYISNISSITLSKRVNEYNYD